MYPRANVLGVLINDENKILLEEQVGTHSRGTGIFYRPLGGTIELGERSDEALIREYKEEIGVDISITEYIACLENIYRIENQIGHEITQIYLVDFKEKTLYQEESFVVSEGSKITNAKWIELEALFKDKMVLFPNGLTELLAEKFNG